MLEWTLKFGNGQNSVFFPISRIHMNDLKPELYGLLIGTFVNLELIRTSKQLSAFLDFIIDVDKGYFDNPYHSFLHAIDVEYMLYFVLIDLKIKNILKFNLIEISALLIAALTHDILHPGLNNLFQVNSLWYILLNRK